MAAITHIITELIRMQQVADATGKSGPLSGIIGTIGNLFGGFGGGGFSLAPTVADAAAAGIPGGGFAMGGNPPVGVTSLVGERGPELFVPSVSGTVIPNHKLGGIGGGAGNSMVVRVEINGAAGNQEVRSLVEQGVPFGIARARPASSQRAAGTFRTAERPIRGSWKRVPVDGGYHRRADRAPPGRRCARGATDPCRRHCTGSGERVRSADAGGSASGLAHRNAHPEPACDGRRTGVAPGSGTARIPLDRRVTGIFQALWLTGSGSASGGA